MNILGFSVEGVFRYYLFFMIPFFLKSTLIIFFSSQSIQIFLLSYLFYAIVYKKACPIGTGSSRELNGCLNERHS